MSMPAFRGRAVVATLMALGFGFLMTSGIVLYASPSGRVARDLEWSFLALGKWQWRDMHMAFGLLFLLTAVCHIWLNFKPLKNYIRQKLASKETGVFARKWRVEPLIALALCVLVAFSAIKSFPPAQYVTDARDAIMRHWENEDAK